MPFFLQRLLRANSPLLLNNVSPISSIFSGAALILRFIHLCPKCRFPVNAKLIRPKLRVRDHGNMSGAGGDGNSPLQFFYTDRRLPSSSSDVSLWSAAIRRCVDEGDHGDALPLYTRMRRFGCRPDHYTFPFVLKACGELPSLRAGVSVHGTVCTNGFLKDVFVCNTLVTMYGRCGAQEDAQRVFDELLRNGFCNLVSWNSIVASYVQAGHSRNALEMFGKMIEAGSGLRPDAVTLVNVLTSCALEGSLLKGKGAHCYTIRMGIRGDLFLSNALVDMYAKCGSMDGAELVFRMMEVKDVVSWNAMVNGYAQVGRFEDATGLLEKMKEEGVRLNVVTWSSVIAAYAQRSLGYESASIFREMLCDGQNPNAVTLVSVLSGCASVGAVLQGKETHCYFIKHILGTTRINSDDTMVMTSLIDMYCKSKCSGSARKLFDSIGAGRRDVATWTSMIIGHAQHGEAREALILFSDMMDIRKTARPIRPNAFTVSSVLVACARLSSLRQGKEIHCSAIRNHLCASLFVSNCLIDMYAKSGDVDAAGTVFDGMNERNKVSWTSMMMGYGMHGRGKEALFLFDRMTDSGVVPDAVTSLVFLYACSHSGMTSKGIGHFRSMGSDYTAEHCACMVDLLGRAGRFDEAVKLIEDVRVRPCPDVWVSLMGACRVHGNVEMGEFAADRLRELNVENDGADALISNIYASAGRWKDVARVRSSMRERGMRNRPGCSWVQGKEVASFFSGDRSHRLSPEIYALLGVLMDRIKDMGYVPQVRFALHDVGDEEKAGMLLEHSEKLALAYVLLTSPPNAAVRITKNLRVCGDCHTAIVFISRIVQREIIIRDSSRFHHFKDGHCSCGGYW